MSETAFPKVEIITGFKCCKCGTTFSTEKQAEDCFDTHATSKEIVGEYPRYVYTSDPGNYNNYPMYLDILFNDGEVLRYRYAGKEKI